HKYFGLHFKESEWIFREQAPNASCIYLIGEMTDWKERKEFALRRINKDGIWELRLSEKAMKHGMQYRLKMYWEGGEGDRIPIYAKRVVQDPETMIFNAQVWEPDPAYRWETGEFYFPGGSPLIYEAHVGMAQEKEGVGTFNEFRKNVLPRIVKAGYNVIQLMGIQEHPYYGSFGYHVSNLFAVSSRFGTPEDLKKLIDAAHTSGLAVVMDIVHSHAVNNEVEGLSRFDGTLYQFFHEGPRGLHIAWDSRCFDYHKHNVLHLLLSNCRFWLEEYRLDGFRFDGITSMLYHHHGLGKPFTSYEQYFDESVDEDALTYLALANRLIHEVKTGSFTIAEDISGMPGLALSSDDGGIGFDFRLAMGVPDYWIKLIKEIRDEDWPMVTLWHELTNRRHDEKTIGYAESHDQALVGDKTLIFRLIDADMYTGMCIGDENIRVDRGMALHRMIRFITIATAGYGYLNFMGNEFGHPEWIDFPREGNGWSYFYARRQWHLVDDPNLKYRFLADFDREMISFAKEFILLEDSKPKILHEHSDDKVIAFQRSGLIFVFNFHPTCSHVDYRLRVPEGKYRMIFESDSVSYGGNGRLQNGQVHETFNKTNGQQTYDFISLYLPTRTALVLQPYAAV
ncbi:MAG: alpha amylase C-terminal domain-containing protein, partial [Deltaproteobacteria bacterium]|nr:alpha amylase C-terminal domain-containing protein [Deltaproteobacteria bacterium]